MSIIVKNLGKDNKKTIQKGAFVIFKSINDEFVVLCIQCKKGPKYQQVSFIIKTIKKNKLLQKLKFHFM